MHSTQCAGFPPRMNFHFMDAGPPPSYSNIIFENRQRMYNSSSSFYHESFGTNNRLDGALTTHETIKRQKGPSSSLDQEGAKGDGNRRKELSPQKHRRRYSRGGYRKWFHSRTLSPTPSQAKFVVVSYNILGDDNASKHSDLYLHIPPHIMDWNRRKRLICEELRMWTPDVMCFQEVDHFDDLIKDFGKQGYNGVFKGRTGEAIDGCAIFWRKNTFTLLHEESIEYKELDLRDNVAQLCVFEMNQRPVPVMGDNGTMPMEANSLQAEEHSKKKRVVVGNIHVLFNPKRGDIKLGQVRVLLQKAHALSKRWGKIPVVIAGDFNCTPQSALYQFLASSKLDILAHDRREISGQVESVPGSNPGIPQPRPAFRPKRYKWSEDEVKTATGSSNCTRLQHSLKLSSTYACVRGTARIRDNSGEPLATSYHSRFMGTLDYIWHSEGLIPSRVLDTLPLDVLRQTAGLPTKKWGSDHLGPLYFTLSHTCMHACVCVNREPPDRGRAMLIQVFGN